MTITDYHQNEQWLVTFDAALAPEEWEGCLKEISDGLQKTDPVPGFRPGKAPVGACVRHYGSGLLRQGMQQAVSLILNRVVQEHDAAPVSQPGTAALALTEKECELHFSYYMYPVIEALPWQGLQAERPVRTCTEADIDRAIDTYMHQHLDVHPVSRPAAMDDIVEVSFTGTHNGQSFAYDRSEKSRFRMGSGQLFAGLDEALICHAAGEELALQLTMPEDFHREEIRGLTLDLQVKLLGVWARELLVCTDTYVREHVKDCSSLAEFREQHRQTIQKHCDEQSDEIFDRNLHKALAELVTCQLPPCMMEQMLTDMMNDLEVTARRYEYPGAQELLEAEGRTVDSYLDQCRPIADQRIRESLALDYIVRTEQPVPTQEEYTAWVAKNARIYQKTPAETIRILGGAEAIAEVLASRKAMDMVKAGAVPIPTDGTEQIRV